MTVAEKTSPSYEQIEKALQRRRERKRTLEMRIAGAAEEEVEARRIEIAKDLSKDPYRRDGLATAARKEREQAERELEDLDSTIETLIAELNRASALRSVDEIKAAVAKAGRLQEARDECWREASALVAQALEPWNRYAGLLGELDALTNAIKPSEALRLAQTLDPALVAQWEQAAVPSEGARIPVDFGAFLEFIIEVALDPRRDGNRAEAMEVITQNADPLDDPGGRTRTVREMSNGRYGRRLSDLIPDLRGQDRRVDVSANIASKVATFGARTPEQSGWQGA
jgi:hypothetical protein